MVWKMGKPMLSPLCRGHSLRRLNGYCFQRTRSHCIVENLFMANDWISKKGMLFDNRIVVTKIHTLTSWRSRRLPQQGSTGAGL